MGPLSESAVKAALTGLDWRTLEEHLDQTAFDGDVLEVLCGHIRRHTDLIQKYPNAKIEKQRATFFDALKRYIQHRLGSAQVSTVEAVISTLAQVEHGYRAILDMLKRSPAGN